MVCAVCLIMFSWDRYVIFGFEIERILNRLFAVDFNKFWFLLRFTFDCTYVLTFGIFIQRYGSAMLNEDILLLYEDGQQQDVSFAIHLFPAMRQST